MGGQAASCEKIPERSGRELAPGRITRPGGRSADVGKPGHSVIGRHQDPQRVGTPLPLDSTRTPPWKLFAQPRMNRNPARKNPCRSQWLQTLGYSCSFVSFVVELRRSGSIRQQEVVIVVALVRVEHRPAQPLEGRGLRAAVGAGHRAHLPMHIVLPLDTGGERRIEGVGALEAVRVLITSENFYSQK